MHVPHKPIIIVILVLSCCVAIAFSHYFFHPNIYLLTNTGDGMKNYFTPAWYVAHDSGTHFSGMLYPYGDDLLFADAQPALSFAVQFLSPVFPGIILHIVGIMHLCIFIALLLCGVFLYLILQHYIENKWVSAIAAIGITLLSPQIERLNGHFALSYMCVVPCIWYLHIQMMQSERKIRYMLLLTLAVVLFSFLHLYFLLTALLFFFTFVFIYSIRKKVQWNVLALHLPVMIVPALCSMLYLHGDAVTDRPDTPYGFTVYRSTLGSLLAPEQGKLYDFWITCMGLQQLTAEGYAYIGLTAVTALAVTIVFLLLKYGLSRNMQADIIPDNSAITYLVTAIVIACFACGLPFTHGLENWVEEIPLIRQFRSPGRFAWIFFYIANVYAVVVFYKWYLRLKNKNAVIGTAVFSIPLAILVFEGAFYFFSEAANYNRHPKLNPFDRQSEMDFENVREQIDPEAYQSILFLPLFMQGSEKLYIDRSNGDYAKAMEFSYLSGIPLMDGMMSRSSLSRSIAITSLAGNPLLEKKLPAMLSDKPVLLLTNHTQLSAADKLLLSRADSLGSWYHLSFYKLPLNAFSDIKSEAVARYDALQSGWYSDTVLEYSSPMPLTIFYRNDFEHMHAPTAYSGKGALHHEGGGFYIDEIPLTEHPIFWIEVSFWTPAMNGRFPYPAIHLEFKDGNGNLLAVHGVNPKESTDIANGWIRASAHFEVVPECRVVRIFMEENPDILIDALLVRHTAADVYYRDPEGILMMNNFTIGK